MNSIKKYKPIIKNGDYLFNDKLEFPFPVEIHFTRMEDFESTDCFKVLVLSNESYMSPNRSSSNVVIDNHMKYDLILCTDDEILVFCENAYKFPYGSTWLNRGGINHPDGLGRYEEGVDVFEPKKKAFAVSFLASWYNTYRPGYNLRQQVWHKKNEITIPKNFYSSSKCFINALPDPLPNGEKEVLFDSQYHVCIENYPVGNYFTEKLIDCFLTETIPVYWGCTNIGDYFNLDGMILFATIDELIDKMNDLTPDYYQERIRIIKENKQKAIKFANFDERIFNTIMKKIFLQENV